MLHHGSLGRVQSKDCYLMFKYNFLASFCFSLKRVFIILISFLMEVSNLRNRILTNQKPDYVVRNCKWNFMVRDDTHKKSMKIVEFSRPPNPLYHLCPKLFHPLTLDVHFQTKLPYLQNDNKSVNRRYDSWMTIICY